MHRILFAFVFAVAMMLAQGMAVADEMTKQEIQQLEEKAKGGDAEAQFKLRKIAEQGDAMAQLILGIMYYNGEGVPKDYKKAKNYFNLLAEKGSASGHALLGDMYYRGRGVKPDYVVDAE